MTKPFTTISKLFLCALASAWLMGCASVARPELPANASTSTSTGTSASASDSVNTVKPSAPPYDAWAKVLSKFVDEQGRVNFAALSKDRADLDRFVTYVYDVGPNNHAALFPTPSHVLAYHINAYNALAMHKVIHAGIPETLAGLAKVSFFALGKVQVGGTPITLYDYENKVIRALGEERIHFALNCMSVGCPRLPREVFLPARLEEQLQRETKRFFNETRHVQVDTAKQTVRLSEILKFYPEDFLAKAPSLTAYVNRYRDTPIPAGYTESFIDYDWTINRQP